MYPRLYIDVFVFSHRRETGHPLRRGVSSLSSGWLIFQSFDLLTEYSRLLDKVRGYARLTYRFGRFTGLNA